MIFDANNETVVLAVTASSDSIALPNGRKTIRVVNGGSDACFIAVGDSTVAATVPTGTAARTATPLLSGSDAVFSYDRALHTHIAAICNATESTTLYISCGNGA